MPFTWLPCVVLCLASVQENTLEIVNTRVTYGYLGALRPKLAGILPGDTAHFTFEIKNLKLDANGKASYSIAIEIRDAEGKLFFEQKPLNAVAQNYLGGNSLPCAAHVELPLDAKPGAVNWKITIKDRSTAQTVNVTGSGKILPADFGIVHVGLFADVEARAPVSAIAVVGDSFYLQFAAVRFARDKETKQPNVHLALRILDQQGKPTMAKPILGKVNAGVPEDEHFLTNQFGITFNREGRFTIELSAHDQITGNRAQISYTIRVLPLE
ncbi:MAG: hypothetical protein EXS16_00600 [Gemmataceae bacterium]|nr:hypothetical protein [Gemmataceae bacterium]